MPNFDLHNNFTAEEPPAVTSKNAMHNMVIVPRNQRNQGNRYAMPDHIMYTWWNWLDSHGGDSSMNIITNNILAPYYQKEPLWNDNKSYAIVARINNDDYTVIAHDKIAPDDALLENYILVPAGAM